MNIRTTAGELLDGDVFYPEGRADYPCELSINAGDECWTYVFGSEIPVSLDNVCEDDDRVTIVHNTKGLRP